ncbi:hypothetical protein D3C71_498730 [compost metagenome]
MHFGLRFIITLATGIFVDAFATLAFDPLAARSTARAALTFGLLLLLTDHGRSLGQIRSLLVYRQDRGVGGGDIDPNLLAQLATFAALGHFLLFFLTRLGADGDSLDGFYRFNHDLGTGLARSTGFASRARGAGFTFLTGLTGFAIHTRFVAHFATGFTFHALFATHFTTGFTLLTGLALFTRTTVAALATLAVGSAFTLLASVGRVAVAAVVIATTTLATAAGFVTLMTVTLILARFPLGGRFLGGCFHLNLGGVGAEQTGDGLEQLAKQTRFGGDRCRCSDGGRGGNRDGRLRCLDEALQQRLLALNDLSLLGLVDRLGNLGFQLVAGRFRDLVLTDAGHFVVRGFQMLVRNDVNTNIIALFQAGDGGAFLVEQIGGDIDRHLAVNLLGVVLHGLFFDETQDGQGEGFVVTDDTLTLATGADVAAGFVEGGTQTLARHFQQTETGDPAQLDAGSVLMDRFTQTIFHFALMANRRHVDEVDDDQATQITQTQLTGNFVGRFQVGLQRRLFDIAALGGAGGVDIDGGQRFGRIDDDAAAGGQTHFTLEGRLDLALDLEVVEQGDITLVQLHAIEEIGAHQFDVRLGTFEDDRVVNQDLADIATQIVTNGTHDHVALLVDEHGRGTVL